MNFSRNFTKYGVQSCYDFVRLFARTFFSEIEKSLLYHISSHRATKQKYFMIGEVPAEKEFI